MHVAMLLYPRMTQLDLTGPYEVLARFEELKIHLVWKSLEPVNDVNGLTLLPDKTIADCRGPISFLSLAGPAKSRSWKTRRFFPFCGGMQRRSAAVSLQNAFREKRAQDRGKILRNILGDEAWPKLPGGRAMQPDGGRGGLERGAAAAINPPAMPISRRNGPSRIHILLLTSLPARRRVRRFALHRLVARG